MPENKSSEWHEQIEFSELYFNEHTKCREAQRDNASIMRTHAVKSKISMAMGILNSDEKDKTTKMKKDIELCLSNFEKSLSYEERAATITLDNLSQTLKLRLDDTLDRVESDLDSMVNKHMPFLNIRQKTEIKGM